MTIIRSARTFLAGVAREPLVTFTLAGACLFAGYAWLNPGASIEAKTPVRVGQGEIRWLAETFSSQWRRDPTDEEMNGLIGTLVQEHLLAREARTLGLDVDDTIIRRRLAQKLAFLVEETAQIQNPDDVELRKYQAANAERYLSAPQISFRQIFYSPNRRANALDDAAADLAGLSPGDWPAGDPLPLEATYSRLDPAGVSALFGPSFAEAVARLTPGVWAGPLKSAYGVHLVLVTESEEGGPRPFEAVRASLLHDWRRQKASDASAAYIDKLRRKYGVTIDRQPAQLIPARTAAISAVR